MGTVYVKLCNVFELVELTTDYYLYSNFQNKWVIAKEWKNSNPIAQKEDGIVIHLLKIAFLRWSILNFKWFFLLILKQIPQCAILIQQFNQRVPEGRKLTLYSLDDLVDCRVLCGLINSFVAGTMPTELMLDDRRVFILHEIVTILKLW